MKPTTTEKIIVDSRDDIATVVDKIIHSPADRVVVVVPKAAFGFSSIRDFQILSREIQTAGKELVIESSDDRVLEFAALAQISTDRQEFKRKERVVADILPRAQLPTRIPAPIASIRNSETTPKPIAIAPSAAPEPKITFFDAPRGGTSKESKEKERSVFTFPSNVVPMSGEAPVHTAGGHWGKRILAGGIGILVIVVVWFVGFRLLPRATISIVLKKTPVTIHETVQISSAISAPQGTSPLIVPGELLVNKGNYTESFPANGRATVSQKATGVLTVYNAFGSESQVLVQGTRFVSPSGVTFRLNNKLTVPGAKVVNGSIVPSKIDASVTADQPGADSNVAAATHWTIPGFQGSPRYEGFYADSASAMQGGFVGERAVATEADQAAAIASTTQDLENSLMNKMSLTSQFKLLDGARSFVVTQKNVIPDPQDPKKFAVTMEGELKYLVFDETTLRNALVAKALSGLESGLGVRTFGDLTYGTTTAQFANGTLSVPIDGSILFEPVLDTKAFAQQVAGKSDAEFRSAALSIKGLESAGLKLSPFWIFSIPMDPSKITLSLD